MEERIMMIQTITQVKIRTECRCKKERIEGWRYRENELK